MSRKITNILLFVIVSAVELCALQSCYTTRHNTTSTTAVHDTLTTKAVDTSTHKIVEQTSITKKDTVVTTPGYDITQTFTPAQLTATHTADGRPAEHSYQVDKGNLHSTVTVDTAGRISIDCRADSLKMVIANLTVINHSLTDSLQHISTRASTHDVARATSYRDIATVTKTWWGQWWKWIVGILLVVVVYGIIMEIKKKL